VAMKELERLSRMASLSPETTRVRNYLDTLISLPWQVRSDDRLDPDQGAPETGPGPLRAAFGEGHSILEFLAVMRSCLMSMKGPS